MNKDGKYEVSFIYQRKRFNSGFTYSIPKIYTHLITNYIKELAPYKPKKLEGEPRFLRNWNVRAKTRIQNTDRNVIDRVTKDAAEYLGYDKAHYSGHSWRRSAATNLADVGVTLTNLKRHGQWKSDSTCEGYIANSKPLREEREKNILPKEHQDPPQESRELNAINELSGFVKGLLLQDKGSGKPAAKAADEINLPVAEKLQESENMEMNDIEYEDVSDTARHNLPGFTFSQLGFSQMELEDHEQAELSGDLNGIPIFTKKAVTPSPPKKNVVSLRGRTAPVYHNCTFVFKYEGDMMKPPGF